MIVQETYDRNVALLLLLENYKGTTLTLQPSPKRVFPTRVPYQNAVLATPFTGKANHQQKNVKRELDLQSSPTLSLLNSR